MPFNWGVLPVLYAVTTPEAAVFYRAVKDMYGLQVLDLVPTFEEATKFYEYADAKLFADLCNHINPHVRWQVISKEVFGATR